MLKKLFCKHKWKHKIINETLCSNYDSHMGIVLNIKFIKLTFTNQYEYRSTT
jgi:hypothetical protein